MKLLINSVASYLSQSDDPVLIERISKLIRASPKDDKEVDLVLPTLQGTIL
jgi:hypothetical protein